VVIGFGLGSWLLYYRITPRFVAAPNDPNAVPREAHTAQPPDLDEQQDVAVFKAASPSVVNVDTVVRVRSRLDSRIQEQQTGTGSGFLWDEEGRVVTNFHVVRQAVANNLTLRVVLSDRSAYDARVVGLAPDYDLAVLQIPAPREKLKPIRVGTSSDLQVGLKAYAIGNPFGLSLTMTKGIISALDREIESLGDKPISGVIQTDAPINPGNSGGPLLDKAARLIGVNTSIATAPGGGGGNVGIGFAIPVDTVNRVVAELIARGELQSPDLGVKLVDQRRIRRAGYLAGVMIAEVYPGSSAARAGLRGLGRDAVTGELTPGDLILEIDGEPVASNQDFARIVAGLKIGQVARLRVERDERAMDVNLTVQGVSAAANLAR
jgi:S1-C subfamily serine protease